MSIERINKLRHRFAQQRIKWAMADTEVETRVATKTAAATYKRLVMFDFDGTLFRSWEEEPSWWEKMSDSQANVCDQAGDLCVWSPWLEKCSKVLIYDLSRLNKRIYQLRNPNSNCYHHDHRSSCNLTKVVHFVVKVENVLHNLTPLTDRTMFRLPVLTILI